RDQAIEFLWPETNPDAGANNLYRTIYALRQTLESELGAGRSDAVFTFQKGVLALTESVWVDVHAFEQLCSQAAEAPSAEREAILERGLKLYAGDLLPAELYADWTFAWRDRLRRRYRDASLTLATEYRGAGNYDRAINLLIPFLTDDPADEAIHRELMHLYALAGQRDAALRQYQACVDALARELDVQPAEETTALYARILSGELSPPPEPQPEDTWQAATPLFGRADELREIVSRLDNPFCRLLTLTGPGGIGKTRLAMQVAADKSGDFQHGVYFVPLAALSSPDFLVPAIAEALKLSLASSRSPRMQLLGYLRDKALLLVLDNFEHLVGGTSLLTDILTQAPQVKLLVTSRERLNLQREWVFEVQGLSCPEDANAADAEEHGAVQLFLHAARRLRPDYALTDRNRPAVIRICHLVGGMPLGIELAAGWVRILSTTAIADEIAHNLDALATTMRDVPERHRSLRAVFEESWQHLTPAEQAVFRRLSVFRGGFSREAAEQVARARLRILS
ncbi:MAG: BTAD domain-containing putative transcriptional regulator, partial [Phycisphaerae bacterium]